mgnify:CR=1 FL=1
MDRWLSVVGIGEDGLDGLSARARALIEAADVLIGGDRHLGKLSPDARPRVTWANGLDAGIAAMRAGRSACLPRAIRSTSASASAWSRASASRP